MGPLVVLTHYWFITVSRGLLVAVKGPVYGILPLQTSSVDLHSHIIETICHSPFLVMVSTHLYDAMLVGWLVSWSILQSILKQITKNWMSCYEIYHRHNDFCDSWSSPQAPPAGQNFHLYLISQLLFDWLALNYWQMCMISRLCILKTFVIPWLNFKCHQQIYIFVVFGCYWYTHWTLN